MTEQKRRMPAEWEPQSMVQLTWPHKDTDWAPMLPEITRVYEEMAREIRKREALLVVDDIPHNDTWARDHGFITVVTSPAPSQGGEVLLLDFCFNGWGEKFPAELDNQINRQLYDRTQKGRFFLCTCYWIQFIRKSTAPLTPNLRTSSEMS